MEGGGVEAPEATEPFEEDGGRSEVASLDSTVQRLQIKNRGNNRKRGSIPTDSQKQKQLWRNFFPGCVAFGFGDRNRTCFYCTWLPPCLRGGGRMMRRGTESSCTCGRPARSPSAHASACGRTADQRSGARTHSAALTVFFFSYSALFMRGEYCTLLEIFFADFASGDWWC